MREIADEVLDAPTKIKQYDPIETGLAKLRDQYAGVIFEVSTTKGLDDAKAARQAIRAPRYELEKVRKALKAPALEYSKRIDSEAKRIEAELLALEVPIDDTIKAEEARREEIKAAKAREEEARRQAIQDRLWALGRYAADAAGLSSEKIAAMREALAAEQITTELYEHRAGEALALQAETLAKLDELRTAALAQEREAERIAQERAELERQRQEQERIRQEQEAAVRAEREAEQARLQAEREAFEKEQAELRAKQKAEQDRIDAERHAENARLEALRAEQARKDAEAAAEIKRQQDEAAAALRAQQEEINRQRRDLEAKQEAERRAEQERQEGEARALREKEEAERQQKARKEAERKAETERREREQFAANGPGDAHLVLALADHYQVEVGDVMGWLKKFDYQATDEYFAAANSAR